MRIFNVMMSRDLGGIQQVFLDYDQALSYNNHEVINITSSGAAINKMIDAAITLPNLFSWCILSKIYFRYLVERYKPDLIIVHGGRATTFAKAFAKKTIPIIGVTHNYNYKRFKECDHILAITEDLKKYVIEHNYPADRLYLLPNMINITQTYKAKSFNFPIKIGAYGRFVPKKGFEHLLKAINHLVANKYNVSLILGGSGDEEAVLKKQISELGINDHVEFVGWVENKRQFFDKIDIFCCPSEHEPFGIVILEAMEYSTPIVATRSEGPQEILEQGHDALLAENKSYIDIANKIAEMIDNPEIAQNLAKNAYIKLRNKYDIKKVGIDLSEILTKIKNS